MDTESPIRTDTVGRASDVIARPTFIRFEGGSNWWRAESVGANARSEAVGSARSPATPRRRVTPVPAEP